MEGGLVWVGDGGGGVRVKCIYKVDHTTVDKKPMEARNLNAPTHVEQLVALVISSLGHSQQCQMPDIIREFVISTSFTSQRALRYESGLYPGFYRTVMVEKRAGWQMSLLA